MALLELIKERIRRHGMIPVDEYMRLCLTHPQYGYYTAKSRLIFGGEGDFVTSPEISPLFGEMIGAFLADLRCKLGTPTRFMLAEAGPGTGACMDDVLRATRRVPGFHEGAEVTLIEISAPLRAKQQERLAEKYSVKSLRHFTTWQDLPPEGPPLLFYANEWLDALPTRQYRFHDGKLCLSGIGADENGALTYVRSNEPALDVPSERLPPSGTPEGAVIEFSPESEEAVGAVARLLAKRGGAALFIDYGYTDAPLRSTLQAVQGHQRADPLACPGKADLTTLVNFNALAGMKWPEGVHVSPVMSQRDFLFACGIRERTAVLKNAAPKRAEAIESELRRLTDPDEMGTLFKVMFLTAPVKSAGTEPRSEFLRIPR